MAEINIEKQLQNAITAVSALAEAKVGVLAVTLSRETNKPHILVNALDAERIILKDKLAGVEPGTYDRHMTPQGYISEIYKVGLCNCVVWFSFLSIPANAAVKSDDPIIN